MSTSLPTSTTPPPLSLSILQPHNTTTAEKNKHSMSNLKVTREKMHTVIFSDLTEYHSEYLQALAIRSFFKT